MVHSGLRINFVTANEKKVQAPGSNPEPGARGIANPTERNGRPKTQVPKTGTWGTRLQSVGERREGDERLQQPGLDDE
jgi:hypothetical protein